MKHARRVVLVGTAMGVAILLFLAWPVAAHDQPDGADWLMADWMLFSFLAFGGAAMVAFLFALKRGYFRNLEDAKYHILSIDEQDYYTPHWALDDDDEEEEEEHTDAER